jgi:hypothetical protein
MARTKKKGKETGFFGAKLEEMLARFIRTKPDSIDKGLNDAIDESLNKEAEVEQYVEERRQSIRKGARRAGKRFRL